jgi:hypothetical protein
LMTAIMYVPEKKILTEGRVRMGEYYNVVWGRTDDEADIAEVLFTGDLLDM